MGIGFGGSLQLPYTALQIVLRYLIIQLYLLSVKLIILFAKMIFQREMVSSPANNSDRQHYGADAWRVSEMLS